MIKIETALSRICIRKAGSDMQLVIAGETQVLKGEFISV